MIQNATSLTSIIIPFYNRKKYVSIMMDSIIGQKYKNWELLMVDDGSTDGTDGMIREYIKNDDRIKLLYRKDFSLVKGACVCRNIGLSKAKGEYIVFFDSDDWITPDCILNRVKFMENNCDIDFAVFPYYNYNDKYSVDGYKIGGVDINEDDFFNLMIRNLPFTVVSNIYKKKSLNYCISWDEKLMSLQDADFNLNCIAHGLKYLYADDSDIDYYVRMYGNRDSISKCVTTSSHAESHLYYLKKSRPIAQSVSFKNYIAFFLLSESLYMLIENGANIETNSMKFLEVVKGNKIIYFILNIKNRLNKYLLKMLIPQRFIYWIIFPELFIIYKKSFIKKGRICKKLYTKSKDLIYDIERLMMC